MNQSNYESFALIYEQLDWSYQYIFPNVSSLNQVLPTLDEVLQSHFINKWELE